jgi:methylenetetrahydrofolate dehydrogenase (NADP+)/methenyltetrahydrofolate cyclohydrolase
MDDCVVLDGKKFAEEIRAKIKDLGKQFIEETGVTPGLAVVVVGDHPASKVYVRNKIKQTEEVGFNSIEHKLPTNVSENELLSIINDLNHDKKVNGILVQLPLPEHINSDVILDKIESSKDVDGFHATNVGKLWSGLNSLVPCTPLGCSLMIKKLYNDLSGKKAVIVGRSNIVGKPMAALLIKMNATVTIVHSRTKNIEEICKSADILVAAVGVPNMVKGTWIKKGCVVIDVGINRIEKDGKNVLVGDVDFNEAIKNSSMITPVPGGVGPMTIACLLLNTLNASKIQYNLNEIDLSSML